MTTTRERMVPLAVGAAALAALLAAGDAAACPVCYGEAESPAIEGAKMSMIFLGGLTYGLLGSAAVALIALRRRVRANLQRHGATVGGATESNGKELVP